MKRLLIQFILLFFACSLVNAAPVSPSRAEMVAKQYLKINTGRNVTVAPIEEPKILTKSIVSEPAFYAFAAQNGGFVIVAGDDRLSPVIGWSPSGSLTFDDMPANIAEWFDMWRNIVEGIRSGRVEAKASVEAEWVEIEKGRIPFYAASGKQLETAQWDQTAPYNRYCPSNTYAGCVAVATAITMRYHQWPPRGQGTLPSYTYPGDDNTTLTESEIPLGHEYNWDNMPLIVNDSCTDSQINAVSQLIHETGVMVKSQYGSDGTGAYTSDVFQGLIDYYFYDQSAMYYFHEYFTVDEWCAMIIDNLENVGPVIHTGSGEEGGHAFVVDGYSGQNQFHINWGWGGRNNGSYAFPGFAEFVENQCMILNIKKDEGGSITELLCIDGAGQENGLSASVTEFKIGEPFDFECKYIFNLSTRMFDGEIALAVRHRDGSIGEIVGTDEMKISSFGGYSLKYTECVLEEDILIGDRLCMWYRSENTPEWTFAKGNVEENTICEVPIADAQSIEEVTSFRYTSSSRELMVSTKADAQWVLADEIGNTYTEGITFDNGALSIDTNKFEKKSYFLTLTKGYDTKTVEFVFGSKK